MSEKGDIQVNWTPGSLISDDQYESLLTPRAPTSGPCEERSPSSEPNSNSSFHRKPVPSAPAVIPANNSIFKRN